jgi:hypothetical protein
VPERLDQLVAVRAGALGKGGGAGARDARETADDAPTVSPASLPGCAPGGLAP